MVIIKGIRRNVLRRRLVEATGGCNIQKGWPCGTCFSIGGQKEWHAVLAYRGDYESHRVLVDGKPAYRMATDTVMKGGTFSHHVYTHISVSEVKAVIKALWSRLEG